MELKKRLSLFILLILILAVFSAAAYAGKGADRPAAPTESHAADLMSFDAMVDRIAEENHITEQKAELLLPESIRADRDEPGIRYMSGKIPLDISHEYMPQIEFMCQVSGDGDDYRVISLFNPQLSADSPHTGLSKQFVGTVKMWLRDNNTVEYAVNGDFFDWGKTTVSGAGKEAELNGGFLLSFSPQTSFNGEHYQYYYHHGSCSV